MKHSLRIAIFGVAGLAIALAVGLSRPPVASHNGARQANLAKPASVAALPSSRADKAAPAVSPDLAARFVDLDKADDLISAAASEQGGAADVVRPLPLRLVPVSAANGPIYGQSAATPAEASTTGPADDVRLQQAYDYLRKKLADGNAPPSLPAEAEASGAPPAPNPPSAAGLGNAATPAPPLPGQFAAPPAASTTAAADLSVSNSRGAATPNGSGTASVEREGNGKLVIHIQNCELREVLDLLGEQGGMNILATNSVQGKVTATLNGVDIQSALDAILKSTGYVARREGEFVFVGTVDEFSTLEQSLDHLGTRVYRPNYIAASELQKLIQPLLTERIGVVTVSSPAEVGISSDTARVGGDSYAGADVVLVRDFDAVLAMVDQIVAEVDVRPLQVHIEAMILSVKLKDTDRYGVDFELLRNQKNVRFAIGAPETALANFKYEDGALKFGFLDGSLGAFLDALETVGDTNVIATPRLMVLNKHRAEIQIGEQKGYVSTTVTETASTQSVQFLDIGALLRLRPFISSDGLIRMELHPELSDGTVKTTDGFTLPEKEVTQVTTNIMVRDGCTVVIGGLMKDGVSATTAQVPLLGNLPWVGFLFRSTTETTERREVLVLITPHIVYEPETCAEGENSACEFHRRQMVYADKMSPFNKRSLGRRYFRLAQSAWAAGDRDQALRFAEMSVQFDPLNRAAIELRSEIWLGKPNGPQSLQAPAVNAATAAAEHPVDGPAVADWLLDDLDRPAVEAVAPLHPLDRGQPGASHDIIRPRKLQ